MTELKFPGGLSEIADRYDAVLCDVWGVIHNGRAAFDAACDALVRFREGGGKVCLITNAPVPKQQVIDYFEPLGVPAAAYDDCVSSGDATREELQRRKDQVFWRMGVNSRWERDPFLYEGLDLSFGEPEEADVLLCVGLRDSLNDHPSDYADEMRPGVDRNIPMICANPDKQVRIGGKLHWCAGALAEIHKDYGGEVVYGGKPHAPIYRLAFAAAEKARGCDIDTTRVLALGDGLKTDILGANRAGIGAVLVTGAGGVHDADGDGLELHLDRAGVHVLAAMEGLQW